MRYNKLGGFMMWYTGRARICKVLWDGGIGATGHIFAR